MNKNELLDYFKDELKWRWSHQSRIVFNFLLEASEKAKDGVVLDAGAGNQRYKPFFEDSIYIAQEHPIAGEKNKKIMEYDILSDVRVIPLKDNSVDLVLSTSSLEHLEFPELFFSESMRILKPGGSLFINVPFAYAEHEVPYDFQRFTRYGLTRNYSHSGFENIIVTPTSSSIYTAAYALRHNVREELDSQKPNFFNKGARLFLLLSIYYTFRACAWALDRGPSSETILPIGWIAKGNKPGVNTEKISTTSKRDFIETYADVGDDLTLLDGKIVPK